MQDCNGRYSRVLPGQAIPSHCSSQNASLSGLLREDGFRAGTAPGLDGQKGVNCTQSQGESVVFHRLKYHARESKEGKGQTPNIRLRLKPHGAIRSSEPSSPSLNRSKAISQVEDLPDDYWPCRDKSRPPCRQSENAYHLEDFFGSKMTEREPERRKVKVAFLRPASPRHIQSQCDSPFKDASEGGKLEIMHGPDIEVLEMMHSGALAREVRAMHRNEPDADKKTKFRVATNRVSTAQTRKTMANTLNPNAFLRDFPVTLNKRKGSALLCLPSRPSTRLPSNPLFTTFSKTSHSSSRAQSSARKASATLLSSLDPRFLRLFAPSDYRF